MDHLRMVESRIQEAMAAGVFEGLHGRGQPLDLRAGELAGDLWLGHHILENEGLLPPWLQLARDIELDLERLKGIAADHRAAVNQAIETSAASFLTARMTCLRQIFERLASEIRSRQDQLNIDAPGWLSERPGLWVEHLLERLDTAAEVAWRARNSSR